MKLFYNSSTIIFLALWKNVYFNVTGEDLNENKNNTARLRGISPPLAVRPITPIRRPLILFPGYLCATSPYYFARICPNDCYKCGFYGPILATCLEISSENVFCPFYIRERWAPIPYPLPIYQRQYPEYGYGYLAKRNESISTSSDKLAEKPRMAIEKTLVAPLLEIIQDSIGIENNSDYYFNIANSNEDLERVKQINDQFFPRMPLWDDMGNLSYQTFLGIIKNIFLSARQSLNTNLPNMISSSGEQYIIDDIDGTPLITPLPLTIPPSPEEQIRSQGGGDKQINYSEELEETRLSGFGSVDTSFSDKMNINLNSDEMNINLISQVNPIHEESNSRGNFGLATFDPSMGKNNIDQGQIEHD